MTDKISNYSTTPGSNNAASPDGWPEGMAPSGVNNSDREFAARVREWYEDSAWVDYGDTIVSSTSTTVSLSGDVTGQFVANRAIRAGQSDSSVGFVVASAYSAPNTSITVSGLDLTGVTQIELGAIRSGLSIPNLINISLGSAATGITQSSGDDSTSIATTAYVDTAVSISVAGLGIPSYSSTITTSHFSITTALPVDGTIPQNTEGEEVLTGRITPSSASRKVVINVTVPGYTPNTSTFAVALFRDSDANAIYAISTAGVATYPCPVSFTFVDSPATASEVTYKVRVGTATGAIANVNRTASNFGGISAVTMTLIEATI